MVHTYRVTGMTCSSCEAKVKSALLQVENIKRVELSLAEQQVSLEMEKHVALSTLQLALGGVSSRYQLAALHHTETLEQTKSWLTTYKPLLLIFAYITLVSTLNQSTSTGFDGMLWMRQFMAGFFLVFSFFKLLNLKGFAESYVMYDVLAKKLPAWAYLYVFIELALGIAYATNAYPFYTNLITFVVMSISIVGVLQSVLNKQKIQCACLGAVFNLPMSTVTIIEDALMIAMAAFYLLSN